MNPALSIADLPIGVFSVADGEARAANPAARRVETVLEHPVVAAVVENTLRGQDTEPIDVVHEDRGYVVSARGCREHEPGVLTVSPMGERREDPERLIEAIAEHAPDPIFVKDRSYRFVFVSRTFCQLVGRSRDELLGRTDYDFFPKDQADFFRAKDVEMFLREGRVVIEEEPITTADGNTRVLATTKVPLRHTEGHVTHLLGAIHDITALKRAQSELSAANAALAAEVSQKTTALGQLAAANAELAAFTDTVSHDLRAPLTSIGAFTELVIASDAGLTPESRTSLRRVTDAVARMAGLLDDLLDLSAATRAPLARQRLDLTAIATDVVAELRKTAPTREVEVSVARPLVAEGDPRLVRLVLENLLGNAWKFTSRAHPARIAFGRTPGRMPTFYVRDNGVGFPEQESARMFEPFQRLHSRQEFPGTGVGLASVKRVVERHGGKVWAEGKPGGGATIWFTLPG